MDIDFQQGGKFDDKYYKKYIKYKIKYLEVMENKERHEQQDGGKRRHKQSKNKKTK